MKTYLDMDSCASCLRIQSDAKSVVRSKDRLIFTVFVVATFSLMISIVVLLMQITATSSDKVVADLKAKYKLLEERLDKLQTQCNKNERPEIQDKQNLHRALEQDIAENTLEKVAIARSHNNISLVDILTGTDVSASRHHRVKRQNNLRRNRCKKKCRKNESGDLIQERAGRGRKPKVTEETLRALFEMFDLNLEINQPVFETTSHPSYSPKLDPFNIAIFPFIKKQLKAVTGCWSTPAWLPQGSKRHKAASKIFKMDEIDDTGKLRILKSGLYLIYAQFTLVGNPTTGFHVSIVHKSKAPQKLLQCNRYSNTSDAYNVQSCFTMGIVELKAKEEIFIQENPNNTGANYSKLSYFGLIKLAD